MKKTAGGVSYQDRQMVKASFHETAPLTRVSELKLCVVLHCLEQGHSDMLTCLGHGNIDLPHYLPQRMPNCLMWGTFA
eukprot:1144214-Pelagomonas_calceolata.AAC.2